MLQLRVEAIKWETSDAATFYLKTVDGKQILYQAGQFITLLFPHHRNQIRRSYSLSSSPTDELLSITVKRIPNGEISRRLLAQTRAGNVWTALEPTGRFILTDYQSPRDIVYFAAGSGITPIYAHIRFILAQPGESKITLVYSNSQSKSTLFYHELNKLATQHPERLKMIYVFSDDANGTHTGRLNNDLVIKLLNQNLRHHPREASFYICGPFAYMRMVMLTLTFMGFGQSQIRKENFVIETAPEKDASASYPPKAIKINFGKVVHNLVVAENQTILNAALQNGLNLPYSCKAGICSSCTAICKSGTIAMSVNDVLTDEDLNAGWILTCTGHPLSDDVLVEFL